jgi:hypothetical protein
MSNNNKRIIDFAKIGVKAYVGRPNGEKARKHFDVESFDGDMTCDILEVKFPETTKTVSSSFFLGMFGQSIIKAGGREAFEKRFTFIAKEHIKNQINKSIERALVSMSKVSLHH